MLVFFSAYFFFVSSFFFPATPNRRQVGEQHFNFGFRFVCSSRVSVHQVAIAIPSVVAVALVAVAIVAAVNHRGAHNSSFQLDFAAAYIF